MRELIHHAQSKFASVGHLTWNSTVTALRSSAKRNEPFGLLPLLTTDWITQSEENYENNETNLAGVVGFDSRPAGHA